MHVLVKNLMYVLTYFQGLWDIECVKMRELKYQMLPALEFSVTLFNLMTSPFFAVTQYVTQSSPWVFALVHQAGY
jgi:hypothetical protein